MRRLALSLTATATLCAGAFAAPAASAAPLALDPAADSGSASDVVHDILRLPYFGSALVTGCLRWPVPGSTVPLHCQVLDAIDAGSSSLSGGSE